MTVQILVVARYGGAGVWTVYCIGYHLLSSTIILKVQFSTVLYIAKYDARVYLVGNLLGIIFFLRSLYSKYSALTF